MGILELVIISLATWRMVYAIQNEKVGKYIRKVLAGEREDHAGMFTYKDNLIAYVTMCPNCLSFWVGICCLGIAYFNSIFLYPFAISASVIIINRIYEHG